MANFAKHQDKQINLTKSSQESVPIKFGQGHNLLTLRSYCIGAIDSIHSTSGIRNKLFQILGFKFHWLDSHIVCSLQQACNLRFAFQGSTQTCFSEIQSLLYFNSNNKSGNGRTVGRKLFPFALLNSPILFGLNSYN